MRKLAIAVVLLFVAAVAFGQAPNATPFSADMTMKMKENTMSGKVYFNGAKMRMDMNAQGHDMVQIHDLAKKISYTLMPQQKMYMEFPYGQMAQQRGMKMPDLKNYDPTNPCAQMTEMTCEKAGSETVNGRSTDKWLFHHKKDGSTTTTWIDKKIHFPIRTQTKDMQMDLTNVQESAPAASMFEIPAGYKKFDMGGMMRGQMPQGNPNDE